MVYGVRTSDVYMQQRITVASVCSARVTYTYTSLFLRTAACLLSALQQAHLLHHLLVLVQQPQVHSDTQQRLGTADPEATKILLHVLCYIQNFLKLLQNF